MPRRTNDPCTTLSLSVPVSTLARLRRLAELRARQGYAVPSHHVLARELLLAVLAAQESALCLPPLVAPPVIGASEVFLPGSPAHLRDLTRRAGVQTHTGSPPPLAGIANAAAVAADAFAAAPPPTATAPISAEDFARAGLVHVAPGLDANSDLSTIMEELGGPSTFRTADLFPKAP